ncbi:MAG: hypothetical protein JWQ90_2558 [Hydrocarboniphaga sp.]|nr:hypothetical protein [Hydrocarboniphaga sp.]
MAGAVHASAPVKMWEVTSSSAASTNKLYGTLPSVGTRYSTSAAYQSAATAVAPIGSECRDGWSGYYYAQSGSQPPDLSTASVAQTFNLVIGNSTCGNVQVGAKVIVDCPAGTTNVGGVCMCPSGQAAQSDGSCPVPCTHPQDEVLGLVKANSTAGDSACVQSCLANKFLTFTASIATGAMSQSAYEWHSTGAVCPAPGMSQPTDGSQTLVGTYTVQAGNYLSATVEGWGQTYAAVMAAYKQSYAVTRTSVAQTSGSPAPKPDTGSSASITYVAGGGNTVVNYLSLSPTVVTTVTTPVSTTTRPDGSSTTSNGPVTTSTTTNSTTPTNTTVTTTNTTTNTDGSTTTTVTNYNTTVNNNTNYVTNNSGGPAGGGGNNTTPAPDTPDNPPGGPAVDDGGDDGGGDCVDDPATSADECGAGGDSLGDCPAGQDCGFHAPTPGAGFAELGTDIDAAQSALAAKFAEIRAELAQMTGTGIDGSGAGSSLPCTSFTIWGHEIPFCFTQYQAPLAILGLVVFAICVFLAAMIIMGA